MPEGERPSRGQGTAAGSRPTGDGSDSRGQTTLDFAIGTSVFLGMVILIFLFVPGALDPFTEGAQAETVTTDRVADDLTYGLLGSPEEPGVLDRGCTVWFFEHDGATTASPSECRYEGETTAERLGLTERQSVNVTVRGNVTQSPSGPSLLCWDAASERLAERGSGDCTGSDDVNLTAGEDAPLTDDPTVTAIRTASLHRTDVTILVEMW